MSGYEVWLCVVLGLLSCAGIAGLIIQRQDRKRYADYLAEEAEARKNITHGDPRTYPARTRWG